MEHRIAREREREEKGGPEEHSRTFHLFWHHLREVEQHGIWLFLHQARIKNHSNQIALDWNDYKKKIRKHLKCPWWTQNFTDQWEMPDLPILRTIEFVWSRVFTFGKVTKCTQVRVMCYGKVKVFMAQSCPTLCDPMDCSPPGHLSTEFSRQEYWSG